MSGIYIILNLENGKHYVGSAKSLIQRKASHIWHLRKGRHANSKLQRAWDKYGELSFRFDIVERVSDLSKLTEREQFWIDETMPFYNILRKARSALGYRHSEKAKVKMSEKIKAYFTNMSDDEKRALKERGKAHSVALTGTKASDETKEKMSATRKQLVPHENSIKNLFEARNSDPDYYYKAADAHAKTMYVVTSPTGERMSVRNMSAFCRKNELSQAHMVTIAKGKRKTHKGWKCEYENENPAIL